MQNVVLKQSFKGIVKGKATHASNMSSRQVFTTAKNIKLSNFNNNIYSYVKEIAVFLTGNILSVALLLKHVAQC